MTFSSSALGTVWALTLLGETFSYITESPNDPMIATRLAAAINAGLLYRGLRNDQISARPRGWAALLTRFAVANIALVLVLKWLERPLDWWLDVGLASRAGWLAVVIGAGAGCYFLVLLLCGMRTSHLRLSDGH